ncbi:MAG: acyltransferase [Bacteroidales bacterium]|nr:acyltransferase [Bacteroidales bacterium]
MDSIYKRYKRGLLHEHLLFIKQGCRYFYSWYFNLRHFPWKIAKRLPIVFYKSAYAETRGRGKIILTDSFIAHNRHVIFGESLMDFDYQCEKTYLHVEGTLTFDGNVTVRRGTSIWIHGNMFISDKVLIGPRVRIKAHNSVTIGCNSRIAHETQIFDTNFHPTECVTNPQYTPISCPIRIGGYCWIGNRTTISKGTVLPDHTTVASNSLVAKNYSDLPPYSLIGGMPAKLLKSDYSRVWDAKREKEYLRREFEWYRERHK